MTLSRQIILSSLIVLLCLFTGMISFVISNTQSFLNQQLASHSQDTATALGLTLTTIMKNQDKVTASRVVDAIWDRGYYKTIIVETNDGKPIVERHQNVKFYDVPQWFIKNLPLETPEKEALIMDGWNRVGKVKIESNPGFAYQQIWLTFKESIQWLLLTVVLAMILGSGLLYIILRPLRAITSQAMAICNQQFSVQEKLPWTIDLRLVVEAMNTMSLRLKQMFEEQVRQTEKLREESFKDPVTQLGNRQYFDLQLDYLLKDKDLPSGALLLIEIKNFKDYNDKFGFQEGDHLLQNVAHAVSESCKRFDSAIIAHAKGASIFAILPNKPKEIATEVAQMICQQFNDFHFKNLSKVTDVGSIGIVIFEGQETKKDIMSHVDMALRQAEMKGANQWHCIESSQTQVKVQGQQEWNAIFAEIIRDNKILLYFQRTQLLQSDGPHVFETLMRIQLADGSIVSAGVFMPMAERLNQVDALDRLVIENVISRIMHHDNQFCYCINLSAKSLDNEELKKWLLDKAKHLGKKAHQLILEFPEYGIVTRIKQAREFFLKFSQLGCKTSIDHYGKNLSSFSYLYNLKLNYLKIDGSFIKNIHENAEHQFFIRSLIDIARSLGILVIAEAVETQEEYNTLLQLKVDGVQGYFVGKPTDKET